MLVLRPYVFLAVGVLAYAGTAAADCEKLDSAAIEAMEQKELMESYCRAYGVALPPEASQSSSDLPGTPRDACLSNRGKLAEALNSRYGMAAPQCSPAMQADPQMNSM